MGIWFLFRGDSPEPSPAPIAETPHAAPAAAVTIPRSSANPSNARQILELFNPSDQLLHQQINETTISQQIEEVFTISYVLTNCGIMTQEDYSNTFYAAIKYAEALNLEPTPEAAEARVRQIAHKASASYSLVYRRTKCNDPELNRVAASLREWQQNLLSGDR